MNFRSSVKQFQANVSFYLNALRCSVEIPNAIETSKLIFHANELTGFDIVETTSRGKQ